MSWLGLRLPELSWQALRWLATFCLDAPVGRWRAGFDDRQRMSALLGTPPSCLDLKDSTAIVVEARGLERRVVACSAGALRQGLAAGMSEAQARLQQPRGEGGGALTGGRSPVRSLGDGRARSFFRPAGMAAAGGDRGAAGGGQPAKTPTLADLLLSPSCPPP